ncbi:hypothetical protein HUJ05_005087 [Dendroctonus ponderosae]|nr:hypothetical protein HUJ05_005087 [Dendroctonus ponderosae]
MESDLAAWFCRNSSLLDIGIRADTENVRTVLLPENPGEAAHKVQKPFGKEHTRRLNSFKGEKMGARSRKSHPAPTGLLLTFLSGS